MMLLDTVCAELEPVPGKDGWFQLTGRNMLRALGYEECLAGCKAGVDAIVSDARVLGFHDQESVLRDDPRFNGSAEGSFAVIRKQDGSWLMVLDVHLPEATLLRFLLPATRPALDEPLPRIDSIEPGVVRRRPARSD